MEVAGRTPYILFNDLEEMWSGVRGVYFLLTDTWVYPFDRYKVVVKLRSYHPAELTVRVTHADQTEEVLARRRLLPMEFYEGTFETSAAGVVGDELVSVVLSPLTGLDRLLAPQESLTVNVPVRDRPVSVVIRRAGAVRAVVDVRTWTLPPVRKVESLGVLGDYEGYERELRSVFSAFRLYFGLRLERNIILKASRQLPYTVDYDGDLTLAGDIEALLPVASMFADYFRSHFKPHHTVRVLGGVKLG